MRLADDVQAKIQAYIGGRLGPRELEGWLDTVAPEIHAAKDTDLRVLTDRVLSLLAELDNGDRTSAETRAELAHLIHVQV